MASQVIKSSPSRPYGPESSLSAYSPRLDHQESRSANLDSHATTKSLQNLRNAFQCYCNPRVSHR